MARRRRVAPRASSRSSSRVSFALVGVAAPRDSRTRTVAAVMKWLGEFGRFWYDFIVGDDWRIAVGVVVTVAVVTFVAHHGVNWWWLLPLAVPRFCGVGHARDAESSVPQVADEPLRRVGVVGDEVEHHLPRGAHPVIEPTTCPTKYVASCWAPLPASPAPAVDPLLRGSAMSIVCSGIGSGRRRVGPPTRRSTRVRSIRAGFPVSERDRTVSLELGGEELLLHRRVGLGLLGREPDRPAPHAFGAERAGRRRSGGRGRCHRRRAPASGPRRRRPRARAPSSRSRRCGPRPRCPGRR